MTDRERERQRETETDRHRERDRDKDRDRETERSISFVATSSVATKVCLSRQIFVAFVATEALSRQK